MWESNKNQDDNNEREQHEHGEEEWMWEETKESWSVKWETANVEDLKEEDTILMEHVTEKKKWKYNSRNHVDQVM